MGRTILAVIVVCAVLAALLLAVLAVRLVRPRPPPAPLPPIQPLAHHRVSKYETPDTSIPHSDSFLLLPPPSPAPRPLSNASISSMSRHTSRTSLRGVPHAPHNNVQIILPAPLSPAVPRRDTDSDRTSLVDKWLPVGRDDFPSTSPRSSRHVPSSTSMSTSPSSYSYQIPSNS